MGVDNLMWALIGFAGGLLLAIVVAVLYIDSHGGGL